MKLSDGKVKSCYVVNKVSECGEKNMLESMGFVNGTKIYVAAKSLLNKTLLIQILNSTVAIKKLVLKNIDVSECVL